METVAEKTKSNEKVAKKEYRFTLKDTDNNSVSFYIRNKDKKAFVCIACLEEKVEFILPVDDMAILCDNFTQMKTMGFV